MACHVVTPRKQDAIASTSPRERWGKLPSRAGRSSSSWEDFSHFCGTSAPLSASTTRMPTTCRLPRISHAASMWRHRVSLDEPPAEQGGVVLSGDGPSKVANQPRQEADGWQQPFLPIAPEAPARNRIEHSSYGEGRRRTAFAQGQQTANPIVLACRGIEDRRDSGFRRVEPAAFCHEPRAV
jgi:hypothetical protein